MRSALGLAATVAAIALVAPIMAVTANGALAGNGPEVAASIESLVEAVAGGGGFGIAGVPGVAPGAAAAAVSSGEVDSSSVVKIYVTSNKWSYHSPWQSPSQKAGSGSGAIVAGLRVITNAHVVSNAAFIEVRRSGSATRYEAEVEVIGHDCDLAILRVNPSDEADFFAGTTPVEFGELPQSLARVAVYGFPIGGEQLSVTSGILSRIELVSYAHSTARLLGCQVDAPINPGNSGGPVFEGGLVVGIAFQGMSSGENIGYMIPTPVVRHFLTEVDRVRSDASGQATYQGFPLFGWTYQGLENKHLRASLGMSTADEGILIVSSHDEDMSPCADADGQSDCHRDLVRAGDVVLSIDGVAIANDGTIEFRPGKRIGFSHLLTDRFVGEAVTVGVLRGGSNRLDLSVRLHVTLNDNRLVNSQTYDFAPTYFIVGGLLFQPLDQNYLRDAYGDFWNWQGDKRLLGYYTYGLSSADRQEVVVLHRILPSALNMGYQSLSNLVVAAVNGVAIGNIRDVIHAFETAEATGGFHRVECEGGIVVVLEAAATAEANQVLLTKYGIFRDRSGDLVAGPSD